MCIRVDGKLGVLGLPEADARELAEKHLPHEHKCPWALRGLPLSVFPDIFSRCLTGPWSGALPLLREAYPALDFSALSKYKGVKIAAARHGTIFSGTGPLQTQCHSHYALLVCTRLEGTASQRTSN